MSKYKSYKNLYLCCVLFVLTLKYGEVHARGLSFMSTKIIQDSLEEVKNELTEYVVVKTKLYNPGTENAYFDINATIFQELPKDVEVIIAAEQLNKKGEYEPTALKIKKNYCTYISMDKLIYPILARKGNFPMKCPVEPGDYYIKNFSVSGKDLSFTIPPGTYKLIYSYKYADRMQTVIWKGRSIQG